MLEWNPAKVSLYLSEKQQRKRECDFGKILEKDLNDRNEPICNANVLDYLLLHQELIPEEWRGMTIYFWGTKYLLPSGNRCIRCMGWDGKKWRSGRSRIDRAFTADTPAICLAS